MTPPDMAGSFSRRLREAAAIQLLALAALLLVLLVVSTGLGFIQIPAAAVVKIILNRITGDPQLLSGMNEIFPVVVTDVRLPRILTAALVGGRAGHVRGGVPGHPPQPAGGPLHAGGFGRGRLRRRPRHPAEHGRPQRPLGPAVRLHRRRSPP